MSKTHFPESMSGPAERKYGVDCSTCHIVESQIECSNCLDAICLDCVVRCAGCNAGPKCIPCAVKNGYVHHVSGPWYCEYCAEEIENEEAA